MTREEELKELAELEELERLEAMAAQESVEPAQPKYQEGQTHTIDPKTKRAIPIPEDELPAQTPSQADSFMMGAVEGIPFAKDLLSAGEATYESLTGEGSSFGESYARNKAELDDAINQAEAKNPAAFLVGDLASGVATPMGSLKGLKGVGKLATFGAASGISRSEDRDVWDAVAGAGISVAGQAVMKPVISTARFVGEKIGAISNNTLHNILVGTGARDKINAVVRKYFTPNNKTLDEGVEAFSNYVANKKIGNDFVIRKTDTSEIIHKKANEWFNTSVEKFNKAIKKTSEKVKVDSKKIYAQMRTELGIDDMLSNTSKEIQDKGKKYLEYLDNEFFETTLRKEKITEEVASGLVNSKGDPIMTKVERFIDVPDRKIRDLDLVGLNDIKKGWAEQSNIKVLDGIPQNSQTAEIYGNLTKSTTRHIHNIVDGSDTISKPLREYSKEVAVASLVKDNTRKMADTEKLGAIDAVKKLLQARGAMFTALAIGGTVGATSGDVSKGITAGIGVAMVAAITGRTSSSRIFRATREISQNLTSPNFAKYVNRLTVAAGLSNDEFRDELAGVVSEVALKNNKVKRDIDSVLDSSEEILNILQAKDQGLAQRFRKALEKNDEEEIGYMFDVLANMPESYEFIEQGIGFNGKVYNKEDAKMLESQVMNADISAVQKAQHLKALRENRIIPKINQEPERFYKYNKRDKSKPSY